MRSDNPSLSYGSLSSSDWLDRLLGKEEAARLHGHVRHGARIQISPGAPLLLIMIVIVEL